MFRHRVHLQVVRTNRKGLVESGLRSETPVLRHWAIGDPRSRAAWKSAVSDSSHRYIRLYIIPVELPRTADFGPLISNFDYVK